MGMTLYSEKSAQMTHKRSNHALAANPAIASLSGLAQLAEQIIRGDFTLSFCVVSRERMARVGQAILKNA